MTEFSNIKINVSSLPQFEKIQLQPLNKKYFNIMLLNISIVFVLIAIGFVVLHFFQGEQKTFTNRFWLLVGAGIPLFYGLFVFLYYLSFKKRGYAFRELDAIYKSGLISETTTIVPFKRIQHVALHQGLFSRFFGLASLELFTAGGSSTDLHVSGLKYEDAQRYKIWIVEKIDNIKETSVESIQSETQLIDDVSSPSEAIIIKTEQHED